MVLPGHKSFYVTLKVESQIKLEQEQFHESHLTTEKLFSSLVREGSEINTSILLCTIHSLGCFVFVFWHVIRLKLTAE